MRKWLVEKLIGNDRKLLTDLLIARMSFVQEVDFERFERESADLWSTIGVAHRGIRSWIEQRKSIILRQNMIEPAEKNGLRNLLMEWELISQFIGSPVNIPQLPAARDTAPELKTQEEIMREFNAGKNRRNML